MPSYQGSHQHTSDELPEVPPTHQCRATRGPTNTPVTSYQRSHQHTSDELPEVPPTHQCQLPEVPPTHQVTTPHLLGVWEGEYWQLLSWRTLAQHYPTNCIQIQLRSTHTKRHLTLAWGLKHLIAFNRNLSELAIQWTPNSLIEVVTHRPPEGDNIIGMGDWRPPSQVYVDTNTKKY